MARPRNRAELLAARVSRARRRRDLGIPPRRRFKTATTRKDAKARPASDLVNRIRDQLFAHITHVPTWAAEVVLVLEPPHRSADGASCRGRAGDGDLEPEAKVVHHSDQGSQYTSGLREAPGRRSRGLGRLRQRDVRELLRDAECELLDRSRFLDARGPSTR